jgi:hypothetical protein
MNDVIGIGGSVTMYRPGAAGNARPEAVITTGVDGPEGLTFDSSGDLWVANNSGGANGGGAVVEYSKAELAKASPLPTVTISGGPRHNIFTPTGLAFDPSGNLWVANEGACCVVEFTKAELAKSGAPKPEVTLSPSNASIAFDPSGDLWQGSNGSDSVSEWAKAELSKSGSPAPTVMISSDSLNNPWRPTFDSAGNLWVADMWYCCKVVEFTRAELEKSGSPDPKVVISSRDISSPGDVALDPSGDLWVPSMQNSSVVEYTKAELNKSGSPMPAETIAGPATQLKGTWAVAIEP